MMGLIAAIIFMVRTHSTEQDRIVAYARRKWEGK